jgi:hypothetical protein
VPTGATERAGTRGVNSLWIGRNLGPVARACLASFARHGHRTVLYCYDPPSDAPAGVELADAAAIIPPSRIFRHKKTASYSLFSNLFRYELQRRNLGLWIDCDVYCVRPITLDRPNVFGWENSGSINVAILALPPDSPVIAKLIGLFDAKSPVLPWLEAADHAAFTARRLAGEEFGLADLPWGSAGPAAFTYLLKEARLTSFAAARSVFYPLAWDQGPQLMKSSTNIATMIAPNTLAIHLWNETLHRYLDKAERGSPLDRLLRHGVLFDEDPAMRFGT